MRRWCRTRCAIDRASLDLRGSEAEFDDFAGWQEALGKYPRPRMSGRFLLAVTVALGAMAVVPVEGSTLIAPPAAFADGEMRVGDRLVAVTDVELDAAIIRAGSHVSVVGRRVVGGGATTGRVLLDVALADGHVVKSVPLSRLRAAFRVA